MKGADPLFLLTFPHMLSGMVGAGVEGEGGWRAGAVEVRMQCASGSCGDSSEVLQHACTQRSGSLSHVFSVALFAFDDVHNGGGGAAETGGDREHQRRGGVAKRVGGGYEGTHATPRPSTGRHACRPLLKLPRVA